MTADDRRPMPPPAHPDLDTLADLHADALDAGTAARARSHLPSCAQCTGVLAALDTVQGELHGLPVPTMPAAVAARLDAALADLRRGDLPTSSQPAPTPSPVRPGASPAGAAGSRPTGAAGSGTGRGVARPGGGAESGGVADLAAARGTRRRRRSRSLGAVAAAVAVIAAGASVTALVRTGGGSDSAGTTAAGSAADSAAQPQASAAAGSPQLTVPAYTEETLRSALPTIAQQSAVGLITGRGDTGPAGPMASAALRTACAGTINGSSGDLQAVQRILWQGKLAYVFVFVQDGRPTGYVVANDCGSPSALPHSVLDTVS
ncbi:MAG TPA: hypothetical protein VGP36_01175 [Mycobacteriales bacterium]|nr:hypothetical protein [Mycobacteriales bacterium]